MRRVLVFVTVGLLAACAAQVDTAIVPAARDIGFNKTVFMGTTRTRETDGSFGIGRSETLQLLRVDVSIPPIREIGSVSVGRDIPNPKRDFVLSDRRSYASAQRFRQDLSQAIRATNANGSEVTVFVHGFNNTFNDAAFRVAQMAHDLELPGSFVGYSWSSRGHPLGYEYDRDSALFGRDGLEELLRHVVGAGNPSIVLIAHSMGGALAMETLRQLEIAEPGWTARHVSGVILISPDLNPEVFRAQIATFREVPDPFLVVVSRNDRILRLSARIRGEEQRLGNLRDTQSVQDLPVTILDITAFSDRKSGNHFAAAGSPALIELLRQMARMEREFLRGDRRGVLGHRRVRSGATRIVLSPTGVR